MLSGGLWWPRLSDQKIAPGDKDCALPWSPQLLSQRVKVEFRTQWAHSCFFISDFQSNVQVKVIRSPADLIRLIEELKGGMKKVRALLSGGVEPTGPLQALGESP